MDRPLGGTRVLQVAAQGEDIGMPETIRRHLMHRARRGQTVVVVLWVGLAASAVFIHDRAMIPWFLAGFVVFAGSVLYAMYVRCPKCRAILGYCVTGHIRLKGSRLLPRPNFCPYCGVSLDEPYPKG